MKNILLLTCLLALFPVSHAADKHVDAMRGDTPLNEEAAPPPIPKIENRDIKRERAYPMQPPTIPHKIDGYQLDKNANRCLACHARTRTGESQAPMVSVTHYLDRDNQFLAQVSPRRYFCLQCHVAQTEVKPLVPNTFKDVDEMMSKAPTTGTE